MTKLKLHTVASEYLNDIPVVSGNVIFLKNETGMYYDLNGIRHGLQSSDAELFSSSSTDELSGVLSDVDLTDTRYNSLVFIFKDVNSNAQFTCELYGEGSSESYSYETVNVISASLHLDESVSESIVKKDIYIFGSLETSGEFSIDSVTSIEEAITNGSMTATSSDYSGNIVLVKVIGRY